MIKNLKIVSLIVMSFLSITLSAQQEVQNSFYMFNSSILNPAYAGSRDALSVVLDARSQWTGWKGAPKTNSFIMHTPLMNESIGVGLNIVNDVIGPTNKTAVFGDFAYRIRLNKNNDRLCFGLRAGADLNRNNIGSLAVIDATDPVVINNTNFNTNTFNTGAGVYYYGKRFFVGLTAPKIIPTKMSKDINFADSKQVLHYYLIAGYVIKLNSLWDLKPGCAIKYTQNAPVSIDGNLSVLFNEKIWFGVMYRHGSAAGANIVYNFTKQLRVGYAYDYSINNMGKYSPSSHEVIIGYDFLSSQKSLKSPRYF
ncbi:MAG: type IX secretion system membrane protein PorP/SprF [Bacteroidota bacterium]|nr:type IX secretion system membrane protein PorP/SprF [Bacteroidota bacterium]MDP3146258.1 type IX secretion system membrane protein PorP/SprF [Bacteroidota bacterium]MDP3556364.1 type IX secretion system membrane protein PorP/SprF [Bacteroidota bacterium]